MPDQLTQLAAPARLPLRRRRAGRGDVLGTPAGLGASLVQALVVLVLFATVGAGLGWLWERWWEPSIGTVFRREWFAVDAEGRYDLASLRNEFAGTAQYVALALGGGVVVGALSSFFLVGRELLALAVVLIGSISARS